MLKALCLFVLFLEPNAMVLPEKPTAGDTGYRTLSTPKGTE